MASKRVQDEVHDILMNKELNGMTKVLWIARKLREEQAINDDLYYAILEMKDQNLSSIILDGENDLDYFTQS